MAENILIPHTWKTLKDDLTRISSEYYGKKVIKLNLWKKEKQLCFKNSDLIIKLLTDNVKDHIIKGKVTDIEFSPNKLFVEGVSDPLPWDMIINTIPLPKFMDMFSFEGDEIMEVAQLSLQWNNMFLGVFIVPSKMVNTFKKIIYFPESDFIFSKIEIDRKNGYTVICCECSFRRNDEDKFKCKPYLQEYLNKIENDLIKARIINSSIISTYYKDYRVISPAYIIPDNDYKQCNDFIQAWMNHRKIYNIGRFAEWLPWMRVEHSYEHFHQLLKEITI
jgi:protoporphyrinogen oxidase